MMIYLTIASVLASTVLCKSADELLVATVATSPTDGFYRFMRSAKQNDLDVEVIGMGQEWTGGDIARYAGGGMKVNLLKAALEKHKDKSNLIIMFVDSYDLVLTEGAEEILNSFHKFDARVVFSAEGFCWPNPSLAEQYPVVKQNEKRFLNSGGIIGYASDLYTLVTDHEIADSDDDQLYYTELFLNPTTRANLRMKLDSRGEIFQNLNGALDDVKLMFKGSSSYLYNHKTGNKPLVVHGNGPIKVTFNRMSNYLVNSWTPSSGCQACNENTISLEDLQDEDYPLVFVAIFVQHPTAFLSEFFKNVVALEYPKSRMDIFLHYTDAYHTDDIQQFQDKYSPEYRSIKVIDPTLGFTQWSGRNRAIAECIKVDCQYYFAIDGDVQLELPEVLTSLIQYNRTVIAPMVQRPGQLWSNFWGDLSSDGFYKRSEDYLDIINRNRVGQWIVPYMANIYLIHASILPALTNGYINGQLDPDMALAKTLREIDTFMFVDNRQYVGHLVNSESFNTERLNGDMYEIFSNEYTWRHKYINPEYYEHIATNFTNIEPCPDVYWLPIMTDAFADDLVSEMEHYGKWSGGKAEDDRLAGGYENVPTVDIHTNQIGWEKQWLRFLKLYIAPISSKIYTGYHSEARAIMNFVVRYKPGEQNKLRPHHDSSTYSIIIALNEPHKDYEGGGTNFVRYKCQVTEARKGWLLMFPGRLTHFHEGLPTTAGIRYIMVSFIDP